MLHKQAKNCLFIKKVHKCLLAKSYLCYIMTDLRPSKKYIEQNTKESTTETLTIQLTPTSTSHRCNNRMLT